MNLSRTALIGATGAGQKKIQQGEGRVGPAGRTTLFAALIPFLFLNSFYNQSDSHLQDHVKQNSFAFTLTAAQLVTPPGISSSPFLFVFKPDTNKHLKPETPVIQAWKRQRGCLCVGNTQHNGAPELLSKC